jgi:hypothetical protein
VNAWEQRLRTELRAESELIGPDSLRPLDLRGHDGPAAARPLPTVKRAGERRGPLRQVWLPPVAAAVAVAVIAAVAGIVSHQAPRGAQEPAGGGMPIGGRLQGVAALSARDVWAVGYGRIGRNRCSDITSDPLIVHWNGTSWRRVAAPTVCGGILSSIGGTSADNLWAVGWWNCCRHPYEPMIMHWNGKKWRLERFADATKIGMIVSVSALSASDAWAVGELGYFPGRVPLILHWNGTSWNPVPVPDLGPVSILESVSAVSADDAWAVGTNIRHLLIVHWNGSWWMRQTAPQQREPNLASVAADSAGAVWAVGSTVAVNVRALIMRRTGSSWQVVPGPKPGVGSLAAVAVVSAHNVWAVGGTYKAIPVILHWNGASWSRSKGPAAVFPGVLDGLAVISADNVWAVGERGGLLDAVPEILHWNGMGWKRADLSG